MLLTQVSQVSIAAQTHPRSIGEVRQISVVLSVVGFLMGFLRAFRVLDSDESLAVLEKFVECLVHVVVVLFKSRFAHALGEPHLHQVLNFRLVCFDVPCPNLSLLSSLRIVNVGVSCSAVLILALH